MMMATRAEVVAEARRWLGTRFAHQGRGADGLDCVGLLIVVARALALLPAERLDEIERAAAGYARYPRGQVLRAWCARELHEIAFYAVQPGDVLLFRIDADPQHLALAGDHPGGGLSVIHASAESPHRVCESIYGPRWQSCAVAAFELPGVA